MSSHPALDLLLLAAFPPDLRGFVNVLGDRLDGHVNGLHIAGKSVGIGVAAAAAASAKRVFLLRPRAVLFVGTTGVYPGHEGYRPHDIVLGSEFHLSCHASATGQSAFPDPMTTRLAPHAGMTQGIAATNNQLRQVPVASPMTNTRDDALAQSVAARSGHHCENLEAFGVAQTCNLANIPMACVLGVSHIVGSTAQTDWRQFQRDASIAAGELVLQWIYRGAAGLPHI